MVSQDGLAGLARGPRGRARGTRSVVFDTYTPVHAAPLFSEQDERRVGRLELEVGRGAGLAVQGLVDVAQLDLLCGPETAVFGG